MKYPNSLAVRIIDVNFNRAREATRVIEDYTRFVLDNESLSAELRHIRHKLAQLLAPIRSDKLFASARNVPDDIGNPSISNLKSHISNPLVSDILVANFKRLQEALRSLAEYTKPIKPQITPAIEKLRFTAYELEQQLLRYLVPKSAWSSVRLYVLVGSDIIHQPVIEITKQVIRGGVDAIQLREKSMPDKVLLDMACQIRKLTIDHNVLFIMNDRVDIALLANADGVHLGNDDIPIRRARQLLGPDKIIGATSHNIEEAIKAERTGADYISVGPMFPSPTKPHLTPDGLSYLKEIARQIKIPYAAIGGITRHNLPTLVKQHRKLFKSPLTVAISSGIIGQSNSTVTARQIKKILTRRG